MSEGFTISEPAREVQVLGEYDVVVCGGGPAGCAAAIGAARHGARTLVVEREGALGGATVTQNVAPILSTNGVDFQGVWHEWARALKRRDGISPLYMQPVHGSLWFAGSVDPEMVKYAWDELLTAAGVDILHLAPVAGAWVEDGVLRGVFVETKAGRRALLGKRTIDATGDADVCAAAGVPWEQGSDGAPWAMAVSLNAWYGGVSLPPDYVPGTRHLLGGVGRPLGPRPLFKAGLLRVLRVDPLDPWDLTRAMREGREQVWERFQAIKSGNPGLFIAGIANNPGVRSSRRVRGLAVALGNDAWEFTKYADGVARSSWEIDIHAADGEERKAVAYDDPRYRPRIERARAGDHFDIRYGCVVARGVDNLLVAGRCISSEHVAQSSLRIQQTCMSTGEAAGVAAALSLAEDVTPRELDPLKVVRQLATDRDVEPAFEELRDLTPSRPR